MMNFNIPAGFITVPDGKGGWIVKRPYLRNVYPCGICDQPRETMLNERKTQVHILPCYGCDLEGYEQMRSKIEQGLI